MQCSTGTPLAVIGVEILRVHAHISNMGPINWDHLGITLLLNAIGDVQYRHILSSLMTNMNSPSFNIQTIMWRFQHEDDLTCHLTEQGIAALTTLAATRTKPRPICSNCKWEGHLVNYCIKFSGGMAGKTINEVRNAQHAAVGKSPHSGHNANSPQVSMLSTPAPVAANAMPTMNTIVLNGI
jgi:hypothetical protein